MSSSARGWAEAILIDDLDSEDDLPPLKLQQKTHSRQGSTNKFSQGRSITHRSQGEGDRQVISHPTTFNTPTKATKAAFDGATPLTTLHTNETQRVPDSSSSGHNRRSPSHTPRRALKRERVDVILISSDEGETDASSSLLRASKRPARNIQRRLKIQSRHPDGDQTSRGSSDVDMKEETHGAPRARAPHNSAINGGESSRMAINRTSLVGSRESSTEGFNRDEPDELAESDAKGAPLSRPITEVKGAKTEADVSFPTGAQTEALRPEAPRGYPQVDALRADPMVVKNDAIAVAPFDNITQMPGAYLDAPNAGLDGSALAGSSSDTPATVISPAGHVIDETPERLPSIWSRAIGGLASLAGAVSEEGATLADALGQIFQADEEAIADMANLKPCSAAVLKHLQAAGLRTELKNHQSSGLKFLVDSEHRKLPGYREGDVCLWQARRGVRGQLFYVNRVTHQMEKSPRLPRGSILADAMGLGKTLTVLALTLTPDDGKGIVDESAFSDLKSEPGIKETAKKLPGKKSLTRKKRLQMPSLGTPADLDSDIEWSSSSDENSGNGDDDAENLPTLIVCPLSVVSNWVMQAKTHLDAKKFRIAVLHGAEGTKLQKEKRWSRYNVIITTYDVLSSSFRHLALLKGHARREALFEKECDAIKTSLAYHTACPTEGHSEDTTSRLREVLKALEQEQAKARLICPTFSGETDYKKADGCLDRARKYRGSENLNDDRDEMLPVIEDQNDLLYCWTGKVRRPANERVFEQAWKRVVLDEAHVVRNPSTIAYNAVLALKAERRHALTGTPLINKTNDIGSLAAWIGVNPYADQSNQALWTSTVERAVKNNEASGIRILRSITKSLVCLRTKEMKVDGKALVELPPMTVKSYHIELKPEDRVFYDNAEMALREKIVQMVEEGDLSGNQSCILVFLARMRQLANDRRLVPADLVDRILKTNLSDSPRATLPGHDASNALTQIEIEALQERLATAVEMYEDCPICMEAFTRDSDPVITWCKHVFHRLCIEQSIASNPTCPLDRYPLSRSTKLIELPKEVEDNDFVHSEGSVDGAKIDAIIEITRTVEASGEDKIIVFSNFTSLLKLVELRLDAEDIPFVSFYGSHTKTQRDVALARFAKPLPPTLKVARASSSKNDPSPVAPITKSSGNALLKFLDQVEISLPTHDASCEAVKKSDGFKSIPRVILMSIGAGSVGINLTAASHVVLVDPWWQSAIEEQAFARAHRLGQTKPVEVYRLVTARTVEERVITIAQEKAKLSGFALQGVTFKGKALWKSSDSQQGRLRDLAAMFGMNAEEMSRISRANRMQR